MSDKKQDGWTCEDWIKKLKYQAEDSREYRHKLYKKVDLKNRNKILDVGCGTGAVTLDIALLTGGEVVGIDIDSEKLAEAKKALAEIHEMTRVTQKGGYVLGTLEPDYASRMDYPEDPTTSFIIETFKEKGTDIYAGRKLKVLFNRAGLKTEIGMDSESDFLLIKDSKKALEMFEKDFWLFERLLKKREWTDDQIEKYKSDETERIKSGLCFHFTPCFYAIGIKPMD
jgi:ubiquinone/menaquinone biosynthesis C-methylase UbiE